MNNKHFIQLTTHGHEMKLVSLSSIALIEDLFAGGSRVTLKEKDAQGNSISFVAALSYSDLTIEVNRLLSLP